MISTLGALTGIAIGTQNQFVILLSGIVIVAVESLSMGVGSYISLKSVKEVNERQLKEEKEEFSELPEEEKQQLVEMYMRDGWPEDLASKMAKQASENKSLFLQEMACRELRIHPDNLVKPLENGIFMFFSYVVGGIIPLAAYFFLQVSSAVVWSVLITLLGLFILGSLTTKFTKRNWVKAGMEMLILAGITAVVGYVIGYVADIFTK